FRVSSSFTITFRQREAELRTLFELRFYPDSSAPSFYDLLANRQSDSRTFELMSSMEPLKENEYSVEILGLNSKPVILNGEYPFIRFFLCRGDVDAGRSLASIFD